MPQAFHVEPRRAALDGYLSYQARLHQVPQVVISRSPGTTRVHAVDAFEDFGSRRMPRVLQQKSHHCVALRRTPQAAVLERTYDLLRFHAKY
jgi:hypothetical protein